MNEERDEAPRGAFATAITWVALLLGLLMAGLAYFMAYPVRWNGLGKFGAAALHFPLHLLVITAAAILLSLIARLGRARLAEWVLYLVVVLTALMALFPTFAVCLKAYRLNVRVSLGDYIANATHVNSGLAQANRSVIYGTVGDSTKLALDVWGTGLPGTGPLRPAMVMIHGGAWAQGNRSMLPAWNRWLNGLGYEVFDVEYRLPPPARWLDEVGDVKSALGWVAVHAAEYHVDTTRISVMGASAGANLALLGAYTAGDSVLLPSTDVRPVRVRCAINLYGPSDMSLLYQTTKSPSYERPLMKQYVGGAPEEFPDRYRLLSPLTHVSAKSPPTITLLGTSDRIVPAEQATLLADALEKAGVAHSTFLLPLTDHSFDSNWGGFATQIARAKIKSFLARYDSP